MSFSRPGVLLVLLSFLTVAASWATTPAHYVVFEIDPEAGAEPVFHRRVTLPESALVGASPDRLLKARAMADNGRKILWVETRLPSGASGYLDVIDAGGEIRGELHGAPRTDGGFEIDSYRFEATRPAFVVRVPVREAGTVLELSGAVEARIDLDDLDRRADQLKLARMKLPASAAKIVGKGSSANRADLLIMGDGYTAAQQSAFHSDANQLVNRFFSLSPYRDYRSYTKVTRLFTASAQSGADHPPYVPGCSDSSCCGDSAAQTDPHAPRFVQTAFDARFCTANVHRLLTVSISKVLAAASAFPAWDQILMLVNDQTYGGSGGSIAVVSLNTFATEVLQHEFGHSFTGLGDEYESPVPGTIRCRESSNSCEPNVTDVTQLSQIKWSPWIAASTPVPTPESSGFGNVVGLFEGARYFSTGQYRPHLDCAMRSLGVAFCEVCTQEFVLRLFRGGFGSPANGIDPIEPGSEQPGPGTYDAGSEPLTISVDLLQPSEGPQLSVRWKVDGQTISGATGSSFTFTPEQAGSYQVELLVDAATPLVHPAMAGGSLISSRTWTVLSDGILGPLVAAFEWQGDQAGQELSFSSTATGEPQSWQWDLGDGTFSDVEHPTHVFTAPGLYPVQLTVSRDGESVAVTRTVDIYESAPGPCVGSTSSLCLQSEARFKVEALWRDFEGETGAAQLVPFASADSGLFWFFDPNNWEVLVKVLDACALNDRYWLFAAATTTVEYALRVVDTENGSSKTYFNPLGNSSPAITDTGAFATCDVDAPVTTQRLALGATTPQQPSQRGSTPPGIPCTEDETGFCLTGERFEVSVTWTDYEGNTGNARRSPARSDSSGVMWFFSANNWELLVKVLDVCDFNQHYWVFAAATTDVEYTLRVRDSETGEYVEYFNPLGVASPSITDTEALAVCP